MEITIRIELIPISWKAEGSLHYSPEIYTFYKNEWHGFVEINSLDEAIYKEKNEEPLPRCDKKLYTSAEYAEAAAHQVLSYFDFSEFIEP